MDRRALLACLVIKYVPVLLRDTSYGGCERQMELDGCTVLLVACRLADGVAASNGVVQGHPHFYWNMHSLVV